MFKFSSQLFYLVLFVVLSTGGFYLYQNEHFDGLISSDNPYRVEEDKNAAYYGSMSPYQRDTARN